MKKFVKPIITLLLVATLLVPTVAMIMSSAAQTYTVELAFENLFVFEQWANNKNSTRITSDRAGGSSSDGTLSDVNIAEGSFKLTSNITSAGIYTTASMGAGDTADENGAFYSMPVKEGHTYKISYNATGSMNAGFHPYVFYYDKNYNFVSFFMEPATAYGDNSFSFTIPEGMTRIQVRFTMPQGSSYGVIKNIAIYEVETLPNTTPNLFDFVTWSTKTGSGGGDSVYAAGTRAINSTEGTVTLTSNGFDNLGGCSSFLTNFALGAYDSTHFTIDTQPGKTYSLSYDLVDTTLNSINQATVLVPWYNSGKTWIGSYGDYAASTKGTNTFTFTVPADVYHFQVVVGIYDWSMTNGKYATVKDIEIREVAADSIIEHKINPTRKSYTYGTGATYGELPTPSADMIPNNYIFAGWYTGENGTGIHISADTPVQPQSYTVYPKYEPKLDSLTVVTQPNKTVYTLGEKFNSTGLVLKGTINGKGDTDGDGIVDSVDSSFNITSGYYCTPDVLNTTGTQTITAHYGGKTATFTVTVKEHDEGTIVINGTETAVTVANNKYTINHHAQTPFNRYEMTYYSDSYVKGVITMDGITEEFFLEPSDNGNFASYIDSFLRGVNHYSVDSIEFTCLDKEYGKFELRSVTTVAATVPSNTTQYYENSEFKVGINLDFGGVVTEIYDVDDDVRARVYNENGNAITKVDYADKLAAGHLQESSEVNLINIHDRGRYLQQSYYGTNEKPFEMGDYNGNPWNYNPVQGGNLESTITGNGGESSKVIDYRITDDQIYIKTRPLDWGKNSVDYADDPAWNTPSYMEAWYVFEDGMIKAYCRFVDFSGYPAATTTQEMPALYTIEPLNHFVYNNVDTAWSSTPNYEKIEEPEFWGILPEYNAALQANGKDPVNPDRVAVENWAAFMASNDADSFGIGVYSAGVEDMHFGTYPAIYNEETVKNNGTLVPNYRHAQTTNPAAEPYTSYISPVDVMTFESYKPVEYSFYITTGTVDEIQSEFETVALKDNAAELAKAKIAVPETAYMTPDMNTSDGNSKVGEYYVNNLLDEANNYNIVTEASRDSAMYLGLHVENAKQFSVKVTNVTEPSNDIFFCDQNGSEINENTKIDFGAAGTFIDKQKKYGLRFSGDGLEPGEKATAKWEITVYFADGSSEVYTAYTVMYAPGRTVGAVAEARQVNASQNEVSSWITGANGVDHSQRSPLGSYHGDYHDSGYFREDPLVYKNPPTGGSGESEDDYIIVDEINGTGTSIDYSDTSYVLQTATNGHDGSRAQSYLGLLTIDKSRYSNTNQIPNLEIGWDALRIGSAYPKNSLENYTTYYTLGTSSSFTSTNIDDTPSGFTVFSDYDQLSEVIGANNIPYRERFIPSYTVDNSINGKYIHAIAWGEAYQTLVARRHSTAGTSVLISVTDKSDLRDLVLDVYSMTDNTPTISEKLEAAATVLGDPSATQEQIDKAKKELNDALMFALKYDNLFSALEFSQHPANMTVNSNRGTATYKDGTITIVNGTITGGEAYTKYSSSSEYYQIALEPNTEYVFEYDVTTTVASQAFLFFYDTNGNATKVTNRSIQTDNGAIVPNNEDVPHFGNYQHGAGTKHYAIRFTTGSDIGSVGFRFGNTTNNPCESTFSNIRLIDSAHYYEDASYEKTEAAYQKNASYGSLITPVRPGYTFKGWVDANSNTVTSSAIATNHRTVYSVWTANSYTVTYNSNGGSVAPTSQSYKTGETFTIPMPSLDGYLFQGWKVTVSNGSWKVGDTYQQGTSPANMYGNVTLTAQWGVNKIPVYFDTILDFDKWNTKTAGNADISNVTSNGFTLTSKPGVGEGTSESPAFPVTAGKQYYIDIDITGDNWDVYIFFQNETVGGTGIEFADSKNRYSSDGGGNQTKIFTAPATATKAIIRLDANGSNNAVTFSDIRVYEVNSRAANVNVPDSSYEVQFGQSIGTLPVPTREGYTFNGWFDENGNQVVDNQKVTYTSAVYLQSKWTINDSALVKDTVVIDFATPVVVKPLDNDKVFTAESGTKALVGVSKSDSGFASSLNGNYGTFAVNGNEITYTPNKVVDGVETINYQTSLTVDGKTTYLKNQIVVAPASNVLYEENYFTTGTASGNEWTDVGTAKASTQSSSNEVYGYDSSYNTYAEYSNGSAIQVKVDATNKRSKIESFTFSGKGFDLYSACGKETGVLVVSLRDNTNNKMVKSYIIDTYYADFDDEGISRYSDILYQVPVLHETGLDAHSNYTVQIVASWLPSMSGALRTASVETETVDGMTVNSASAKDNVVLRDALTEIGLEDVLNAEEVEVIWFDDNSVLNGGTGATAPVEGTLETAAVTELLSVIDSVRVYHPLDDDNQYYSETETGAQYFNIMDNLVNIDAENGNPIFGANSFFAYISGKIDEELVSIESYKEVGPKDELYLTKSLNDDKAITFSIKNFVKDNMRVMISLRTAMGTHPTVKIGKGEFKVDSNTEMYYDITDYIKDYINTETNVATVTIQNKTLSSLLSVGSVKITSAVLEPASLSTEFDLETARAMMFAPIGADEPEVPEIPEDPTVPEDTTDTTDPSVPEDTTDTTDPSEPEDTTDTTDPSEPEDTTDTTDPADPEDTTDTTDPAGSEDDNESKCWLVIFFKWLIGKFAVVFNALKGILGF